MAKFNYSIDETLLPNVWVTWATTKNKKFDKRYWFNCQTGVKKDKPESWMYYPGESGFDKGYRHVDGKVGVTFINQNEDNIWVKNGCKFRYAYIKYHPDIDMIEMAVVEMPTTREDGPRHWRYAGDKVFVNKNKKIVNENGVEQDCFDLFEWHRAYDLKQVIFVLQRVNTNDKILNEFKKFLGKDYFVIGNGRCVNIRYLWDIQTWATTTTRSRLKGKKQTDLDKLVSIPLSDATHLYGRTYYIKNEVATSIAYYEHINDDLSVIRVFTGMRTDNPTENYRMYVCSNGKHKSASFTDDGWVPTSKIVEGWGESYAFVNKDEAVDKNRQIQYAVDALKTFDESSFVRNLIRTLNNPEIEQFVKLGCEPVAQNLLSSSTCKADLKDWFGDFYNGKAKSILNRICLTKPQLDIYMNKIKASRSGNVYNANENYRQGLKLMRRIFGDDLRPIDNQSFEKYLYGCASLDNCWVSVKTIIDAYLNVDSTRFIKNVIRIGEKNHSTYQLVRDTLNMLRYWVGETPEFDWYFDGYSDIVRVHDTLTTLRNEQEARRRALWDMEYAKRLQKEDEARAKLDKERKKYEYEDNEFIIRLPRDVQEIINEGSKQNICIGGYTTRHSLGETNLFFLRRKDSAEVPFYAIEMKNNSIVQIHGFGNKWLGNNPEAIPTVVRWLRQHGIRCDNEILTCKARGYCSTREYVEMPIVD